MSANNYISEGIGNMDDMHSILRIEQICKRSFSGRDMGHVFFIRTYLPVSLEML